MRLPLKRRERCAEVRMSAGESATVRSTSPDASIRSSLSELVNAPGGFVIKIERNAVFGRQYRSLTGTLLTGGRHRSTT